MATNLKRHKGDTKTFRELDFSEQAKSINVQISILGKGMSIHCAGKNDV